MLLELERIRTIKSRLTEVFNPSYLEVIDDSAEHIGHAGNTHGAGHYTVVINANAFKTMSRITVHRAVMSVLADLIPEQIHALQIRVANG